MFDAKRAKCMKLVNTSLLESYRTAGACRACGQKVRMRCAAHIFSRGAGRVDIRANLVSLGMDALRDCPCHNASHDGNSPTFDELLALSAEDHKCRPEDIHQVVYFIRRLDKDMDSVQFKRAALRDLDLAARRLMMKEFEEFRHLLD